MSQIIQPGQPNIITVTLKRLKTRDDLGGILPPARVGQDVRVDMNSIRPVEVINTDGVKHNKIIVDTYDENGNKGDWVYAELFFDDDRFKIY